MGIEEDGEPDRQINEVKSNVERRKLSNTDKRVKVTEGSGHRQTWQQRKTERQTDRDDKLPKNSKSVQRARIRTWRKGTVNNRIKREIKGRGGRGGGRERERGWSGKGVL